MRHNKKINHLGRTKAHREAMLSNMASSLIKHKRIFTTLAKAKSLRTYIEPSITKSKPSTKTGEEAMHDRRVVFAQLQDKYAVTELFSKVADKVGDRPGGYTRIIKTGNRLGDNASMCFIELVDFNENMLKDAKKVAAKTRRSRRKTSTPTSETSVAQKAKSTATTKKVAELKEVIPATEEIAVVKETDDPAEIENSVAEAFEASETPEIYDTDTSETVDEK
jgi:large subunit ribosomal protein L17